MSDDLKPSRLLSRLEAEIAGARTQVEADCKRAERAAYLVRVGRFDEARAEVGELQDAYASSPNARISSWVHLVVGLVEHFRDMNPKAYDRILRAFALSSAANLVQLKALSAAWLAQMDYLRGDPDSMVKRASESLRIAEKDDHAARARAALVIAQAYHLAGRIDLALPWYGQVRIHASADGDEATLSALMHNMAWLRGQRLRMTGWLQTESGVDEGHALLGAESVANFDAMIGSTSLSALVPVLRAQICAAEGRFGEALAFYEASLETAVREGMGRLQADLVADQAWCRVNLGQTERSLADAMVAEAHIDPRGYLDDRAMAHGRLAQVFARLGDIDRATRHRDSALAAFAGHEAHQSEILRLLQECAETRSR